MKKWESAFPKPNLFQERIGMLGVDSWEVELGRRKEDKTQEPLDIWVKVYVDFSRQS